MIGAWATALLGVAACEAAAPTGAQIAAIGNGRAVPACTTCHGPSGAGNAALGSPRLAGLPAAYLEAQLQAFASGRRANAVMQPVARALSPRESEAVATFYSREADTAPAANVGIEPSTFNLGEQLANGGRWTQQLPACVQCHGRGGLGVGANFPPLTRQPSSYLQAQLHAWQSGMRDPGPMGLMAAIARRLSERDVQAVAAYFSAGAPIRADRPFSGVPNPPPDVGAVSPPGSRRIFSPPPESAIPHNEFGEVVRRGRDIFDEPARNASAYVGNRLRCSSCHLDSGRLANSSPMWAAYVAYPSYRAKNRHVNTFAERLQDCFTYSMNGKAPPLGDPVLVALESYAYWLATGAPIGPNLPGRGYPKPLRPAVPADYSRGQRVYGRYCALCHGVDGAGQDATDGSMAFPALWGDRSFNWGAGMGDIGNAAAFIQANMPLSQAGSLTDQDAWDVATFIDSHDRPQDPRFSGSVASTRAQFHDSPDSMYGRRVAGKVLGESSPAPGGRLSPKAAE